MVFPIFRDRKKITCAVFEEKCGSDREDFYKRVSVEYIWEKILSRWIDFPRNCTSYFFTIPYHTFYYSRRSKKRTLDQIRQVPARVLILKRPYATKYVHRGGSFLCHRSYCKAIALRPEWNMSRHQFESNLGFRCVMTDAQWKEKHKSAAPAKKFLLRNVFQEQISKFSMCFGISLSQRFWINSA